MEKNAYTLIIEPILTEKSNDLREAGKEKISKKRPKRMHYTFRVHTSANKSEVAKAIKTIYGVTPIDCRIINVKPKRKNQRMNAPGYTAGWKKAVVTVSANDKIEIIK